LKEWFDLTPKYSDSVEFSTAQDFQDKYLKFQDRNKIQQKEGVTQRKTEEVPTSKQVNDKEKVPVQSENLKENNLVKYGAIVGVVILLLLIRFLVL